MNGYIEALTSAGVLPPIVNGSSQSPPRLQAADYCCESPFLDEWPQLLQTLGPGLHSASQHRYPGVNGHFGEDDLAWLLSTNGTKAPATLVSACGPASGTTSVSCLACLRAWQVAPWAAQAASQGFQFVIGEGNSVNGGGLPNVR